MTMDEKLIGHVFVDSGQIMVTDPCYIRENWKDSGPAADDFTPGENLDYSYTGACNATLSDEHAGVLAGGFGVASSSGYGDGSYPVYATYCEGGSRIKELRIVFISDDYDESDGHPWTTCGYCHLSGHEADDCEERWADEELAVNNNDEEDE
jgi:hypothetical protein